MAMFKAFKPSGMEKIARSMGYQGSMDGFQNFLATNPARQQQMDMYTNKAMQMARGGVVKMQEGGTTPPDNIATTGVVGSTGTPIATVPEPKVDEEGNPVSGPGVTDFTVQQMYSPGVPVGGETVATGIGYDESQDIAAGTGTVTGTVGVPTAITGTAQAEQQQQTDANLITAKTSSDEVNAALNATNAAQSDPNDPRLEVQAAQQTQSSVGNLQAAQGNAILIDNPVQRQLQDGELISGTGVDAAKAAALTAQTQAAAAAANPSQQAMVQGQLRWWKGGFASAWPLPKQAVSAAGIASLRAAKA